MSPPPDTGARPGQFLTRNRRLIGALLFLLLLGLTVHFTGLRDQLTPHYLQQRMQENVWSGLAIFTVLFALGNLVHIPGWIFLAAAVYELGPVIGGAVTYVAASLSCTFTFLTIHWVGGNAADALTNRFALRLLAQLHAHPVRSLVILRTFFQTLPALNYALAISRIKVRDYVLGTLIGLPLPIAVYCVFFDFLVAMAHRH